MTGRFVFKRELKARQNGHNSVAIVPKRRKRELFTSVNIFSELNLAHITTGKELVAPETPFKWYPPSCVCVILTGV